MAERLQQTPPSTKLQTTTMTFTQDAHSSAASLVPDPRPDTSSGHHRHSISIHPTSENTLADPSNSDNKLSTLQWSAAVSVHQEDPTEKESIALARKRDKAKKAGKTGAKAVGSALLGILGCFCFVLGKACVLDGGGASSSRTVVYANSPEKADECMRRKAMLEMERKQYQREMMYRKPGPKPRSRATSQVHVGASESGERPSQGQYYRRQGSEGTKRRPPPPERRSTGTIAVRQGRSAVVADERRQMERMRSYRSAER